MAKGSVLAVVAVTIGLLVPLALIRGLALFHGLGCAVLLGVSRKRFIGSVLEEPRPRARLWGTAAVCALAVARGTAVLRVHDVGPIAQVVRMAAAVVDEGPVTGACR